MSIGKDGTATLTPVDRVLKFQREFRKHGTEVERPQLDRVNRMKQWHAKWHQQATSGASLTFQEQEEEAARRRRSTPNASAAGGAVDAADVMGKTPYGEGERSGAGVDSDQASTYTDADEDDFRRSDDEAEVVDTGGPGSMVRGAVAGAGADPLPGVAVLTLVSPSAPPLSAVHGGRGRGGGRERNGERERGRDGQEEKEEEEAEATQAGVGRRGRARGRCRRRLPRVPAQQEGAGRGGGRGGGAGQEAASHGHFA